MAWIVEVKGANYDSTGEEWGPAVVASGPALYPEGNDAEAASTFSSEELARAVLVCFRLAAFDGQAFDSACVFRMRELT